MIDIRPALKGGIMPPTNLRSPQMEYEPIWSGDALPLETPRPLVGSVQRPLVEVVASRTTYLLFRAVHKTHACVHGCFHGHMLGIRPSTAFHQVTAPGKHKVRTSC